MPEDSSDIARTHQRAYPPRAAHLLCYLILGLVLAGALLTRCYYPLFIDRRAAVNQDRILRIDQKIDPNTASWQELACLPAIGEVKARRIVRYRQEQGGPSEGKDSAVFHQPEDLQAVHGIGPKTAHKISPYLKFPTAGQLDPTLTPRGPSP